MYVPWLAKFLLNFPPPKILRESRYRTLEFSRNAIQNLSDKREDSHAILYNMIKAVDPETGEKLTKLDILSGTNNLMCIPWIDTSHISNAASDTTSVAFTFLLYNLLANRQCWDRLASEIRSQFQSVDEINNHSTLSLQYLDAVIHEGASFLGFLILALRLRPSVPSNLQRMVPSGGMMIAGQFIPGGVTIFPDETNQLDCGKHVYLCNHA